MKMSPVALSSGDGKIASSEYGMLPNVGAVTALLQGPQMYGVDVLELLRACGRASPIP